MKGYVTVVMICISLIANDVGYLLHVLVGILTFNNFVKSFGTGMSTQENTFITKQLKIKNCQNPLCTNKESTENPTPWLSLSTLASQSAWPCVSGRVKPSANPIMILTTPISGIFFSLLFTYPPSVTSHRGRTLLAVSCASDQSHFFLACSTIPSLLYLCIGT